jgi:hypothetical protein
MNGGAYGHLTWANAPASRRAEFSDLLDMGYAGPPSTIGSVMSTIQGELCYLYL